MARRNRNVAIIEIPGKPKLFNVNDVTGFETIGVIKMGDRGLGGALLRNIRTGIYVQANAGAIRSLPQHKVIAALKRLDQP